MGRSKQPRGKFAPEGSESDRDKAEFLRALEDTDWLVEAARNGSPAKASWLLNILSKKLKANRHLTQAEAEFLADSLQVARKTPSKAAKAFGLIAPSNAPTKRGSEADWKIFHRVREYNRRGYALKDSKKGGSGAYSMAADELHVSAATAERAYKACRRRERAIELDVERLFDRKPV